MIDSDEHVGEGVSAARVLARTCTAEWTRLWTVKTTWWFLMAATLMLVGLGALIGFESAADPAGVQGEPAWTTARFLAMPAQFALLGLALIAVTSDYATGGITVTLQWTPRRAVIFLARTIVTVGTATGIGGLLTVAAALAAFTTAGGALTLSAADGYDMLGKVTLVFMTGTALAAGLGFLLRNTAGALISVLLLILILPLLLPVFGAWMQAISELLPGSGAIFLLTGEARGMNTTSSVAVMLAWASAALLLGGLRLMRDDANR